MEYEFEGMAKVEFEDGKIIFGYAKVLNRFCSIRGQGGRIAKYSRLMRLEDLQLEEQRELMRKHDAWKKREEAMAIASSEHSEESYPEELVAFLETHTSEEVPEDVRAIVRTSSYETQARFWESVAENLQLALSDAHDN